MPVKVRIAIRHVSVSIGVHLAGAVLFDERECQILYEGDRHDVRVTRWETKIRAVASLGASSRNEEKPLFFFA